MFMEVSVVLQGPITAVAVTGDIDGLTAESLTQTLAAHVSAGSVKLVADLSGVPYISSAGLRALLITVRSCRTKGGDFRIASVQPGVQGVLSIACFDKLFKIYDSLGQACDSFAA
jgi:anti-sigma B factor antagonist